MFKHSGDENKKLSLRDRRQFTSTGIIIHQNIFSRSSWSFGARNLSSVVYDWLNTLIFRSNKDCNGSVQDGAEHAETLVQAPDSDGGTFGDFAVGDGTSRNRVAAAALIVYFATFMFVACNIMYIIMFIQM